MSEKEEILKILKDHDHAFCPVHEKPYAVRFDELEKAGTIEVCRMCLRRIEREDRVWMRLIE